MLRPERERTEAAPEAVPVGAPRLAHLPKGLPVTMIGGVFAAAALAACGGASAPAARPKTPAGVTAGTWAAGITASEAAGGTGVQNSGVTPWLAPPGGTAPTAGRNAACPALKDPGWKAECVRVDTGRATLTGLVESRSPAADQPVWKVEVWRMDNGRQVEVLAAGDPTTPLWSWASVRAADVGGQGHPQLVFGFENQGTGRVLDLDVVAPAGGSLLASQISVYKGTATLARGRITTYHPVYRDSDPNCCPTGGGDRDLVELRHGQWEITGSRAVGLPGPDGPGLPNDFGPPRLT